MILPSFIPVMRAEGFDLTTGGIPDLQSVFPNTPRVKRIKY